MPTLTIPLTGAHFHPPAKLIIPFLPTGAKLQLRPGPANFYDPHAISVWFDCSNFDISQLSGADLEGMGFAYEDLENAIIQLGWVARQASLEHPRGPAVGNIMALEFMSKNPNCRATLTFAPTGQPQVTISAE